MQHTCRFIFFLLLTTFLLAVPRTLKAQLSPADSVHYWLDKSIRTDRIDTADFNKGTRLLNVIPLTDSLISVFENKARRFPTGIEGYWGYRILLMLFQNLSSAQMDKAIEFGRRIYAETEKLTGAHSRFIQSAFLKQLRLPYRNSKHLQEGFAFFTEKLKQSREKNDSAALADCYYVLGGFYRTIGLLDQAIYNSKKSKLYMDSVHGFESAFGAFTYPNGRFSYVNSYLITGLYQLQMGEYPSAIQNFRLVLRYFHGGENGAFGNSGTLLAQALMNQGRTDSVEYFLSIALNDAKNNSTKDFEAFPLQFLAEFRTREGNTKAADSLLDICEKLVYDNQLPVTPPAGVVDPDYYRALVRARQNRIPEAIEFMEKDIIRLNNNRLYILRDLRLMANWFYEINQPVQEAATYRRFMGLQDSLLADQAQFRTLSFEAEQEMDAKEFSISNLQSANKISTLTRNFSIGMAILLLLLAAGFYQRFRYKHKANQALEMALSNLKATQAQLVQSEKMASLGELTAGIAHEIQNPLNFVNNFSEVNSELIAEMKQEIDKGNLDEVKSIASDIDENEQKIIFHGKRADAIVKGMLQHSRSSNGIKEPTDINALCDEYLRLSYHGLRAKDKSFNATLKTDFDPSIGAVNIISQDIGRVILNLLTNAFYVVDEKKTFLQAQGDSHYEPTVSIRTLQITPPSGGRGVEIRVSDNGNGIPQKVMDKIFQPFFTTKPTGQGTGLGLSLSYDIITKGHNGELKIETKEGEGTTFIISLPC